MANVFVSYERSDEATARQVIKALGSDHEVWSDALIPPHRDYTDVIEEQLRAAQVVLVLWSKTAASSQWVRAEADYARENGKLVQLVLDTSNLPMPFNRIQCARLSRWSGDPNDPEWLKVVASVEQLSSGTLAPAAAGSGNAAVRLERSTRSRPVRWVWLGALVVVAVGVAGAWWLARNPLHGVAQPKEARVAIMPFDILSSGEDARFFADGLTDQILTTLSNNHFQVVSRDDAVTLRGPDRDAKVAELGVALLFDGTVRSDGNTIDVRVHLEDPAEHAVLWSKEADGAAAEGPQLQARIAHTIVGVLACSNRALRPTNGLRDAALLARYLRACDIFTNQNDGTDPSDTLEMLAALREVTVKAPDFVAAHSDLAKFDAYLAPLAPPDRAVSQRQEAADQARRALALAPDTPDAYLAQAMLLAPTQWAERERLLRQGVASDPNWPHTNGFLGKMLAEAGRVKEASQYTQAAVAADIQIDWTEENLWIGAGAGATEPCIEGLSHTLKLAPRKIQAWFRLLQCLEYAGRWDDARTMVAAVPTPRGEAWTAFVVAAQTRAPSDLAKAKALALATARDSSLDLTTSIQSLATLGFIDEAFVLAEAYAPGRALEGDSAFLFFQLAAPLRRDVRFMRLAARIGLLDYWRTSGHWPDFCSEPGLPYNCQDEAARLAEG